MEIRGIIRKIILRILNEADIYRDHNFWVDPSGKVNGPFDHGHVGYILKVAIPQKKVSLTPPEISFIEKETKEKTLFFETIAEILLRVVLLKTTF
ncbi:MAG: hypothetical protein A3K20_01505 [Alphaproteobacteria bacterium GWA1_45_9]|nr:MAG: hypothetical protein A3K20_01505 [Alphaproteobacteria bacterium GWA1_45_9]